MASFREMLTVPFVVTIVANFVGSLQYGYNVGVPSNIQTVLEKFMNETITDRDGKVPSEDLVTNLWAIIAAVLFLGGAIGATVNRWLSQHNSRRRALLINIVLGVVATLLESASRRAELWEILLAGRLLMGIHSGIYAGIVPVYLSEISRKEVRGAVTNLSAFGMTLAVVIGMVMGFPNVLGTRDLWDVIFGIAIVPIAIQLLLLPFCVESPRYLMITKRDTEAARRALQKLRGSDDVEDEIKEMEEEMENVTETVTFLKLFRHPPTRRATIIGILSHVSQQICGSNGVLYYANNIFQDSLGFTGQVASYLVAGLGSTCFVLCLVATPLSEVAGRRKLQLTGLTGLACTVLLITVCLALRHEVAGFDIAAVFFVLAFVIFLGIGPVCIPWVLTGELFAQNTRPIAASVAVTSNWFTGFVVTYAFSPMEQVLKDYVFLPYGAFTALIAFYTYHHLPETKGKTQQEILASFERPGDFTRGFPAQSPSYTFREKTGGENGGGGVHIHGNGMGTHL